MRGASRRRAWFFAHGRGIERPPRYHPLVPTRCKDKPPATLPLDTALLKPGLRVAVGLSGGADSVALLRVLAARSRELGLVLHAAHLHHGLRGAEADGDLEFARELAAKLGVAFHEARVDTAAEARANPATGKPAETIEEAARRLRYSWFRELLGDVPLDAVATAHTLDDQAETVLAKFLRGAWTEGLGGISPVFEFQNGSAGRHSPGAGRIIRPLLAVMRAEIVAYLNALGQTWREDSSNQEVTFTRNRIRHELLPLLEGWNPRLRQHLAQMAELARDEEAWWQVELARVAPQLVLPGKPVRGGGRASGTGLAAGLAIDVSRLGALAPALQRRVLRHAAAQLGAAPDFAATESLRALAFSGRAGQKCELQGVHAERTVRELRLESAAEAASAGAVPAYTVWVPGEVIAPAFGLRLRLETFEVPEQSNSQQHAFQARASRAGTLRTWEPGDRVRLRHSGSLRKVKEILERLRVSGSARALWPVLELEGRIVWMRGVELEPEAGVAVYWAALEPDGATACENESSAAG